MTITVKAAERSYDEIALRLFYIRQSVQVIQTELEGIVGELGMLVIDHPDDDAKELAASIQRQFCKLQETFDAMDISAVRDWQAHSVLGALDLMITDEGHHEKMSEVRVELERQYRIVVDDEPFTDEGFQAYIDYMRIQFGLSGEFCKVENQNDH